MHLRSDRGDINIPRGKTAIMYLNGSTDKNAEPTRRLARIEQRIEDLCQRIDQKASVGRSPVIRDQQAWGQAQEATSAHDSQDDEPNVRSSVTDVGSASYSLQQRQGSASLLVASDDGRPLAVRANSSFELPKGTLDRQSLLPSLSSPISRSQNPGERLLETLGPLAEASTEVYYLPLQSSLVSCCPWGLCTDCNTPSG
jgi:hypothetical protein